MEYNKQKEKWITDVLSSTQGRKRVQPDNSLYEKVALQISSPGKNKARPIPVIRWAAAAVFLLAVNISSVLHYSAGNHKSVDNTGTNPLRVEIQSVTTYNY